MKNITQHDLDLLKILSKDTSFSRLAYLLDSSKEITVKSYDEKDGLFKGFYEWIDIFGTIDEMNKTQEVAFEFEHVSFTPNNTSFEGFKEELVTELLKEPSEANNIVVDKLIKDSGLSLSELPDNAEIIFNDYAKVFCLHFPDADHPHVTLYNEKLIKFDSLDCALKLPYEQARVTMNYLPKESRDSLDNWKEYLDSDEFCQKIESDILQRKEVVDAIQAYYKSDLFKSDLAQAKLIMTEENIGQIDSQYYAYGPTPTLNEKTFWSLVDAAFQENEHDTDPNCDFHNEFVDIDGLRFFKMYGQGTFIAIRLLS